MVAGKTYHTVWDDNWYTWYDKDEIPDDVNADNDKEDYLRDTDICPGTNEKYTRENCPVAPDCSKVNRKWGPGKLCINRVPLPFDTTRFYVAAMKCIPNWENCDKCVCGLIDYKTGLCKYHRNHNPDDDRQEVDCANLERIGYKVVNSGSTIEFRPFRPLVTKSPTKNPTASPTLSFSPSSSPTTSPSRTVTPTITSTSSPSSTPTAVPSYTPSSTPTAVPSYTPSHSPTSSPSVTPSSAAPTIIVESRSTIRSTVGIVSMIAGVTIVSVTGIIYFGSRGSSKKQTNNLSPPFDDEGSNYDEKTFENEDASIA